VGGCWQTAAPAWCPTERPCDPARGGCSWGGRLTSAPRQTCGQPRQGLSRVTTLPGKRTFFREGHVDVLEHRKGI
jgi:hypothetical protein